MTENNRIVTGDPRTSKGWFSKRHPTSAPLEAYRAEKQRRQDAKMQGIRERAANRARLTNAEQLAQLDRLLGKNMGAKKERARLERSV